MRLRLIHVLPLLSLLFVDASCEPEDEYIYLQSHELSIFNHGVGSWWVYQNDSTGLIDTVRMTENVRDFKIVDGPDDGTSLHLEQFTFNYSSAYFPGGIGQRVVPSGLCTSGSITFPGTSDEVNYYGDIDEECSQMENFPAIVFNGTVYESVVEYTNEGFEAWDSDTAHFYFAPNTGCIKWYLNSSDTCWTLVDYHLN